MLHLKIPKTKTTLLNSGVVLLNNSYNTLMEYNDKNQITKKTTTTKKSFEFSYDKNGNILDDGQKEYTYTPFGALLTSTNPTSSDTRFKKEDFKGYTSHEQYFDLNLINMKGRMYDPTIGRFLSPDIFIQSPTNSQSFNRYAYVWNNPLKYTDPSGYYLDDGDDDFDFSDPYDDTKTTTTNNNTNNNTKSNDGWDTADLYDDTGTNVVGTVDFNANTGEFMSQNTVEGTYEGVVGGYSYGGYLDGSAATNTNLKTGEINAYGGGMEYHQSASGFSQLKGDDGYYSHWGINGKNLYSNNQLKNGDINKYATAKRVEPTEYHKAKAISDYFGKVSDWSMYASVTGFPGFALASTITNAISYSLNPDRSLEDDFNQAQDLFGDLNDNAKR